MDFADEAVFSGQQTGFGITGPTEKTVGKSSFGTPVWIEASGLAKGDVLGFEYPFVNRYLNGKFDTFSVPAGYKLINIEDVVNRGAWPEIAGPGGKYTLHPLTKALIPAQDLNGILKAMEIEDHLLNVELKKKLEDAELLLKRRATDDWAPENNLYESRQEGFAETSRVIDVRDSDFVQQEPIKVTYWFDIQRSEGTPVQWTITLNRHLQMGQRDEFDNFVPIGNPVQVEEIATWNLDSMQWRTFGVRTKDELEASPTSNVAKSLRSPTPSRDVIPYAGKNDEDIYIDYKPLELFIDEVTTFGRPRYSPEMDEQLGQIVGGVQKSSLLTEKIDYLYAEIRRRSSDLNTARARKNLNQSRIKWLEQQLSKLSTEWATLTAKERLLMNSANDINPVTGRSLIRNRWLEPEIAYREEKALGWINILNDLTGSTEDPYELVAKGLDSIIGGKVPEMEPIINVTRRLGIPDPPGQQVVDEAVTETPLVPSATTTKAATGLNKVITRANEEEFKASLEAGGIYIGRPGQGKTGVFGNPYQVREGGYTVEEAVALYRKDLLEIVTDKPISKDNELVNYLRKQGIGKADFLDAIKQLKGKDLVCPGKELADECHGVVLAKAINYLVPDPEAIATAGSKNVVFGRIDDDPEGIFVFGSNLAGIHGAGAAKDAADVYGAVRGIGEGLQGRSYALPTKRTPSESLTIEEIKESVNRFLQFAKNNPEKKFYVTSFGTKRAGFTPEEIAQLFDEIPENVIFTNEPNGSKNILGQTIEGSKVKTEVIDSFKGEYDWLSNFYPVAIFDPNPKNLKSAPIYPTLEHAFQALKFKDIETRRIIADAATPAEARRLGKTLKGIREDWEQVKVEIMEYLLRQKFGQVLQLKQKLINTGDAELIEGNTWGDTFWGVSKSKGQNQLGKLLMKLRDEYRGNK
jgi:ribA/ribD-fused uncharacterized protein